MTRILGFRQPGIDDKRMLHCCFAFLSLWPQPNVCQEGVHGSIPRKKCSPERSYVRGSYHFQLDPSPSVPVHLAQKRKVTVAAGRGESTVFQSYECPLENSGKQYSFSPPIMLFVQQETSTNWSSLKYFKISSVLLLFCL